MSRRNGEMLQPETPARCDCARAGPRLGARPRPRLRSLRAASLEPRRVVEDDEPNGPIMDENEESEESFNNSADSSERKNKKRLGRSTNTLPTDSESSSSVPSSAFNSSAYSNASSSYVDSWE